MLSNEERALLLKLARDAIYNYISGRGVLSADKPEYPQLLEERGSFVTLHKDGNLRGCIGKLHGDKMLYKDIIDNAISAAFRDPRFDPLEESELDDVKIEISVLTKPIVIEHKNTQDLLRSITQNQDGIILSKSFHSATFLPQVWEQLPSKESFLSHLSMKAGLKDDAWKGPGVRFFKYQAEMFEE